MKWITILFTLFIILIIVLADMGYLAGELKLIHSIPLGDKVGHFLLIGTLAFLVTSTFMQTLPQRDPKLVALSVAFALAAIFTLEEISQDFIPGRDASWKDLFANYSGIIVFSFIAWSLNKKRKP